MAQPSVYFSAGRLTMLQRNVLDAAGMERLLSTASLPEARKTLSELGWTGADITDPEQLAADERIHANRRFPAPFELLFERLHLNRHGTNQTNHPCNPPDSSE